MCTYISTPTGRCTLYKVYLPVCVLLVVHIPVCILGQVYIPVWILFYKESIHTGMDTFVSKDGGNVLPKVYLPVGVLLKYTYR